MGGLLVPFRMEGIALDVEVFHLGLADIDALFAGRGVERALDFEPALVVVAATGLSTSGRPRQVCVATVAGWGLPPMFALTGIQG